MACSSTVDKGDLQKPRTVFAPKGGIADALASENGANPEAAVGNYSQVVDYSRGLGFGKETSIDQSLEGHEYFVEEMSEAKMKAAQARQENQTGPSESKSKNTYTLQFATIGNFDAAQARKFELAEKYGLSLFLKFDPPFYKLQGGHYSDKQQAEDRAADLRDNGISAFVVKLR